VDVAGKAEIPEIIQNLPGKPPRGLDISQLLFAETDFLKEGKNAVPCMPRLR
jgi:hypothetical protein